MKRIQSHRGVEGILIINNDGVALKSTMSAEQTSQYSAEMSRVSTQLYILNACPNSSCTFAAVCNGSQLSPHP